MSRLLRCSTLLRGLAVLSCFISIEVNRSIAKKDFSKCYSKFCYYWNGKISHYDQLEPCPEPYWNLEIYGVGVQNEVMKFINYVNRTRGNHSNVGYNVPLNLTCENATICTWKRGNRKAKNFTWEKNFDWNETEFIYYFRTNITNETIKWDRTSERINDYLYARFCMKAKTSTDSSRSDASELPLIIALAVCGTIVVVLLGVVVLVVAIKRLKKNKTSSSSPITRETTNNNISQQNSSTGNKAIYAEIPNTGSEDHCNLNQPSMQYADLKWSENILQVQQNISKPIEDQTINYCGPMGDVYARVQKT